MDVWIDWAKKKGRCIYCPELIKAGSKRVRTKRWMGKGRFPVELRYHFQCWVDKAEKWFQDHPYASIHDGRGRPKLVMEEEAKSIRLTLLRRRAALTQQRKRLMENFPDTALKVIAIDERLDSLVEVIQEYGGPPKRWLP